MAKKVRDNNGVIHSFPDDATDQEINSSLDEYEGLQNPQLSSVDRIKNIIGLDRTPIDTLRDSVAGIVRGLGKGGETIADLVTGGYAPKGVDYATSLIESPNKSMGGELTKGIASYLPYGIAGGASIPGQLAAGAASGSSLANSDEENFFGLLPKGKLGAGIEGALLNLLPTAGMKTLEGLRPSKIFRGNLSPEELQRSLDVTQGTQTPLGDVIQSPKLKRQFENKLPDYPFSNTHDVMQQNGRMIQHKGEQLVESIAPQVSTEEQNSQLMQGLKQAEKQARSEKNSKWEKVNNLADNANLKVGRGEFTNKAKEALDDINESPELKQELGSDIVKDLERYANNQEGNNLKLSNIFKSKLKDKANDLYVNNKKYESGLMGGLADSLQSDIDSAIEKSGSKELKDAYDSAKEFHRVNYAPFEDKDIMKFTRKGGDADVLLSHFIRTGKNDRSNLASKLIDKLPETHKLHPLKMLLNKAVDKEGNFSSLEFNKIYTKLSDNQKDILIPDPKIRKQLDDYSKLVGMNGESLSVMANPKTGQRGIESLGTLRNAIMALVGSGAGAASAIGSVPGAIGGVMLPALGARMATKALTSPSIRESLVRKMIENKSRFDTIRKRAGASALSQGIANALNRNQE